MRTPATPASAEPMPKPRSFELATFTPTELAALSLERTAKNFRPVTPLRIPTTAIIQISNQTQQNIMRAGRSLLIEGSTVISTPNHCGGGTERLD